VATSIEVALVGLDVRQALATPDRSLNTLPADELSRAWQARPRVVLDVEDDETVAQILDRVAAELDVYENTDWSLGFGTGRFVALRDDASPIELESRLLDFVTLVDADGHARWAVYDFSAVTYAELRVAAAAGAMNGDPTQLYFHVRLIPAGGWAPWEWPGIIVALNSAWVAIQVLANANDVHDLYGKILLRLAGRDVVTRKTEEWVERNGIPEFIERMLSGDPWKARDLAGLLGVTTAEAESVLMLYGYEKDADGDRWNKSTDLAAKIVNVYRRDAAVYFNYGFATETDDRELRELLHSLLSEALETGSVDTSEEASSKRISRALRRLAQDDVGDT